MFLTFLKNNNNKMNYKLKQGNCLEVMKELEDNSIDSIVSDSPYGINFLNKKWDYDIPSVEIWKECLRVLKPGGHMLIACGTRTQHRMVCNIEDAGFEVRDIITWNYGQGFPKSLNVKKNIDILWKTKLENVKFVEQNLFQSSVKENGQDFVQGNVLVKVKEKEQIEFVKIVEKNSTLLNVIQNEKIGTKEYFVILNVSQNINLKTILVNLIPVGKVEDLNEKTDMCLFQLEMINMNQNTELLWKNILEENLNYLKKYTTLTELKTTTELKIWNLLQNQNIQDTICMNELGTGIGSNLKPAQEFWTLVRKPLSEKTIVDNVLKWGTGGINIDKSRIGSDTIINHNNPELYSFNNNKSDTESYTNHIGRFPSNFIHDGSEEVMDLFPTNNSKSHWSKSKTTGFGKFGNGKSTYEGVGRKEEGGSASRFFYCAKVSPKERNMGLDSFEDKRLEGRDSGQDERNVPHKKRPSLNKNNHPTLKPVKLMSYLCNLITPINGIILDPFMGSGSTGIGALLNGFSFIGIELDSDYLKIAEQRIKSFELYREFLKK